MSKLTLQKRVRTIRQCTQVLNVHISSSRNELCGEIEDQ